MEIFDSQELTNLYKPAPGSGGEENGQVAIVGGSKLFHGAPLLSLKAASKIVDMVFFGSPEESLGEVAAQIKASLASFIWVPWDEVNEYIEKSDAVLVGPGLMRFHSEKTPHGERMHLCDEACELTQKVTKDLLLKFPNKRWVIDAGSLQVMDKTWVPPGAILTPNKREYEILFGSQEIQKAATECKCVIVLKGVETIVASEGRVVRVLGGNAGMTKGGTGDVQAGVTVGLYAKNDAFLAAAAAAYITKKTAELLSEELGSFYNAEDLAEKIGLGLEGLSQN